MKRFALFALAIVLLRALLALGTDIPVDDDPMRWRENGLL